MGLSRYFKAMGYSAADPQHNRQMTNASCALLTGKANKWMNRLEILGEEPNNMAEFIEKFNKQFMILDDEFTARDKLKELRQHNSVQNYISKFDDLILSLPGATVTELIHAFINGLKSNIKGFVRAQIQNVDDPELQYVMTLALQFENSLGEPVTNTPAKGKNFQQQKKF